MTRPTERSLRRRDPVATANAIAMAVPTALLAGALAFQFLGGLVPCTMCVQQRWPLLAAVVLAGMAVVARTSAMRRTLVMASAFGIATSARIAVVQLGAERAWWPLPEACMAAWRSKGQSGPGLLETMMRTPFVRCDRPQWTMLGLSLADANAIVSGLTALAVAIMVLSTTVRRREGASGDA